MWIQQIILLVLTSQAIYYVGLLFQCLLCYKSPTYFHVYFMLLIQVNDMYICTFRYAKKKFFVIIKLPAI